MKLKAILTYASDENDIFKIIKNLTLFIKNYVNENIMFQDMIKKIGLTLDIPKSIIEKRTYQIIFRNYNVEKRKFIFKNNLFYICKDFLIVLGMSTFLLLNYFLKKKKKIEKFDLICDGLSSDIDIYRHKLLSSNFLSTLLLVNKKLSSNNENTKIINTKSEFFNFVSLDLSLEKRLSLILLLIKIFFSSIYNGFNFTSIFKFIVYDIIKYKKIYSQYSAKYYFNYKFYDTNPIQNFLFKETGGIKTSCFQKSLCLLPLSCFVYSDIFFSLGKEQGKICNDLGGEIKLFKPVGSFFIESTWLKQRKDLEKIPDIDVLIIGMNVPWKYSMVDEDFKNSYYNKFIPWIKKISEDFPDKKIIYKHHSNFAGDTKEKNLLSQSNVKIIANDDSINSSYAWAFKSKINLSFGSTMILELNGNGKEAFFIDPDGLNQQWLHGIKDLEKYRVRNYETLKKIIENSNIEKSNSSSQYNSYHCLKSDNTSKVIADILKETKFQN